MSDNKQKQTNPERSKKDAFDILGKKVKIYRTASKVWQLQIWVPEEKRYVRESLRTEDKEIAIKKAEDRFVFYRSKVLQQEKIFSVAANEMRDRYLDHIEKLVESRQLSRGRANNIKTYTKHYLDFVGKSSKIQNIDPKKFREYFPFRRQKKADILATVVRNEIISIKQMYRYAMDIGLINQNYKIDFGSIKIPKDESIRDSYTVNEYNQLISISKNWHKSKTTEGDEDKYYRRLINDFILLMANGGFRTGELRLLKWKDIKRIYHTDNNSYAEITIRAENTKTRKSRTFEMRRGDVFERIRNYSKFTEKEDFVFSDYQDNKELDKTRLYKYFNKLTDDVKKKYPDFDDNKDLYCLRHFFISIRIEAGSFNVYDIAKICGTSLVQIQKHYDAVTSLVTSKKMNKSLLRFDNKGNVVVDDLL